MTSFLISSVDKVKREAFANTLCHDQAIESFDITVLSLETDEKSKKTAAKQSIGIEEIKQLQQKLYLKPIRSPQKAIIIHDAQLLTTEAQNALLKVLEEPPEQTIIILTTESVEALLPTILSRCKIVQLEEKKQEINAEESSEITAFYTSLENFSVSQALEYAERIGKSKNDALSWLEKAIRTIREKYLLTSTDSVTALIVIKHLQDTHTLIKTTNVNVRMALEHTFLSFVSI